MQNINSVHKSNQQSKLSTFCCSFNIANKVSSDFTNKPETKEAWKIKALYSPQAVLHLHLFETSRFLAVIFQ